jgi:hypothetical protein
MGLRRDQMINLTGVKSPTQYKQHLRRAGFHDKENGKRLAFLTNNFELPALTITRLYKSRW